MQVSLLCVYSKAKRTATDREKHFSSLIVNIHESREEQLFLLLISERERERERESEEQAHTQRNN